MTPFQGNFSQKDKRMQRFDFKLLVHCKALFRKFLVGIGNRGKGDNCTQAMYLEKGYFLNSWLKYISIVSDWSVSWLFLDLGRMYNLVARIPDGLGQLRTLLENHITSQGLNALEKCGDQAFNVSVYSILCYCIFVITIYSYMYINFRE